MSDFKVPERVFVSRNWIVALNDGQVSMAAWIQSERFPDEYTLTTTAEANARKAVEAEKLAWRNYVSEVKRSYADIRSIVDQQTPLLHESNRALKEAEADTRKAVREAIERIIVSVTKAQSEAEKLRVVYQDEGDEEEAYNMVGHETAYDLTLDMLNAHLAQYQEVAS